MNFIFIFFSSSDLNLLRKKSVKQKIKKLWPKGYYTISRQGITMMLIEWHNYTGQSVVLCLTYNIGFLSSWLL